MLTAPFGTCKWTWLSSPHHEVLRLPAIDELELGPQVLGTRPPLCVLETLLWGTQHIRAVLGPVSTRLTTIRSQNPWRYCSS